MNLTLAVIAVMYTETSNKKESNNESVSSEKKTKYQEKTFDLRKFEMLGLFHSKRLK